MLDSIADNAEGLQAEFKARAVTAYSTDGSIMVEVSADGAVRNWQLTGADQHTRQLVANLIELIGQARIGAQQAIRAELDAISDRDDTRAARDAVRDALARTTATPTPTPSAAPAADSWDEDYYEYEYRGKSRIKAD
ncbi:hypothetical protein D7D52_33090 [Nocardia yunnanensis]|uniref:YbaB/EbfC family DNA-binding protein n=1 Tax=Nocardia yunnanensis TaxID=2382165 RepID=A0A386ZL35_9NOCA|nr:hypothetical protein [Nocardia yunnanensis]AYF77854.1 hypothetical protein D7D52_33090 [Nocardia yunnanensis]